MTYKNLENMLNMALNKVIDKDEYNERVERYEKQGITRSDAQGMVDIELLKNK